MMMKAPLKVSSWSEPRTQCILWRALWYCENEKVFCDEGKAGVVFPQGYDADRRPLTVAFLDGRSWYVV